MKKIRFIILSIFAFVATILHAQIVEIHFKQSDSVSKFYMNRIDSIVYIPAQDWNIKLSVDSFYTDLNKKLHVVATAIIGPDAHTVQAAIGNNITSKDFMNQSVNIIPLEVGKKVQTIDVIVPDSQTLCNLYVATKNKYNLSGYETDYYVVSTEVNYDSYCEKKSWTPWTTTKKEWVAAGYDAEDWPLSEDASTCTYTYGNMFSGDDTELPISYRLNLNDPEVAQIKIDNWCYGVSLVLDYNPVSKQIRIPMQTSGYIDDSLGEFFITDVSGWQGKDYTETYPCNYDPETGLIVLNSAWVLADMSCYGYGVETIQLDGFYIPD